MSNLQPQKNDVHPGNDDRNARSEKKSTESPSGLAAASLPKPASAIDSLSDSDAYAVLSQADQITLQKKLSQHGTTSLREILTSENYNSLSSVDQGRVLRVFTHLPRTQEWYMADIVTGRGTDSNILGNKDFREEPSTETLIAHLDRLATQTLAKGLNRADLLGSTVRAISFAGTIDQGAHKGCAVSSLELNLFSAHPAEATRLLAGMTSEKRSVKTVGGDSMVLQQEALPQRSDPGMSTAERIMQSSLLQLANGPNLDYDFAADEHRNAEGQVLVKSGVGTTQLPKLFASLFGKASDHHFKDPNLAQTDQTADPAKTRLRVDDGTSVMAYGHAPEDFYQRIKSHPGPTIVGMESYQAGLQTGHIVTVVGATDSNVFIVNSDTSAFAKPGDHLEDRFSTVVSVHPYIERMSKKDFLQRVQMAQLGYDSALRPETHAPMRIQDYSALDGDITSEVPGDSALVNQAVQSGRRLKQLDQKGEKQLLATRSRGQAHVEAAKKEHNPSRGPALMTRAKAEHALFQAQKSNAQQVRLDGLRADERYENAMALGYQAESFLEKGSPEEAAEFKKRADNELKKIIRSEKSHSLIQTTPEYEALMQQADHLEAQAHRGNRP